MYRDWEGGESWFWPRRVGRLGTTAPTKREPWANIDREKGLWKYFKKKALLDPLAGEDEGGDSGGGIEEENGGGLDKK